MHNQPMQELMITAGSIKGSRLILTAESPPSAGMVRTALAGKNKLITIAPYGNTITPTVMTHDLILDKDSGSPYTYEEVRGLLKKIEIFGRIRKPISRKILEMARQVLDAQLTLFYATPAKPSVELAFSYNWASIAFDTPHFNAVFEKIRDKVKETQGSNIKIFSNNDDIISVHNYAMQGIYINRDAFEGIADILSGENLVNPEDRDKFILRATAFGAYSVSYMEARQLCKNADEHFRLNGGTTQYNPLIGAKEFVVKMMDILHLLADGGRFNVLKSDQLKMLQNYVERPAALEDHKLSSTLHGAFSGVIQNFRNEIDAASRAHA